MTLLVSIGRKPAPVGKGGVHERKSTPTRKGVTLRTSRPVTILLSSAVEPESSLESYPPVSPRRRRRSTSLFKTRNACLTIDRLRTTRRHVTHDPIFLRVCRGQKQEVGWGTVSTIVDTLVGHPVSSSLYFSYRVLFDVLVRILGTLFGQHTPTGSLKPLCVHTQT